MMNLVQEMEIMKMVRKHVNLLSLLGCCTKEGPLYVILEYAPHGNLRDVLRGQLALEYKSKTDSNSTFTNFKSLSQKDLLSFAYQTARGMEYLVSQRVSVLEQ